MEISRERRGNTQPSHSSKRSSSRRASTNGNVKQENSSDGDRTTANGNKSVINGIDNLVVENESQRSLTSQIVSTPSSFPTKSSYHEIYQNDQTLFSSHGDTSISPRRKAAIDVVAGIFSSGTNVTIQSTNDELINAKNGDIDEEVEEILTGKTRNRSRRPKKKNDTEDETKDLPAVLQRPSRRQSPRTLPRVDNPYDDQLEADLFIENSTNKFSVSSEDSQNLSTIDGSTYVCLLSDLANEIYDERVFPSCFPWFKSKVLLAPSTPRDIDEMAAILKCDYSSEGLNHRTNAQSVSDDSQLKAILYDALHLKEVFNVVDDSWKYSSHDFSSRSIFEEPFNIDGGMGYSPRLFESNSTPSLSKLNGFRIHTMRSADPGVMLMTVAIKPFTTTSEDNHVINEEKQQFVKNSGNLPWSWNNSQKERFFDRRDEDEDEFYSSRAGQIEFTKTYSRQFKISVRVAGTSSRSSLFPWKKPLHDNNDLSSEIPVTMSGNVRFRGAVTDNSVIFAKRKLVNNYPAYKRARVVMGNMPALVQNGNTISLDTALAEELDSEENVNPLGSYDCRPTNLFEIYQEELLGGSSKRDGQDLCIASLLSSDSHKNKRVNIGRTRIIWSAFPRDGFGQSMVTQPGPGVRLPFLSTLTSGKLDSAIYKRPRDVHVAVRVNGEYIVEKTRAFVEEEKSTPLEILSSPSSVVDVDLRSKQGRKRRVSSLYIWELRNQFNSEAVMGSCIDVDIEKKGACVFQNNWTNAMITINRTRFFNQVMKLPKTITTGKGGKTEDASVHNDAWVATALTRKHNRSSNKQRCPQVPFLKMKFEQTNLFGYLPPRLECFPLEDGNVRSICASVGSLQALNIQHIMSKLCADKGNGSPLLCSICWESDIFDKVQTCVNCGIHGHKGCCFEDGEQVSTSDSFDWRCALCCTVQSSMNKVSKITHSKKRRSLKIPSKFRGTEFDLLIAKPSDDGAGKVTPSLDQSNLPKCYLCPHSGGIMSRIPAKGSNVVWAHDLCRLWCQKSIPIVGDRKLCDYVCCLCGKSSNLASAEGNVNAVVKCAAKGCYIRFHAMCALLVTKTRCRANEKVETKKRRLSRLDRQNIDIQRCLDYTLDVVEVTAQGSSNTSKFVPIAYCGLHNPLRDDNYFGLPSCGGAIVSSMRIPGGNQDTNIDQSIVGEDKLT